MALFASTKFCIPVLWVAQEVTDHATQEAAKTMATKAFSCGYKVVYGFNLAMNTASMKR